MIVRVYEVVKESPPQIVEVDGNIEQEIGTDIKYGEPSRLIAPKGEEEVRVRPLTTSDSYDVLIKKIRTPAMETSLRIVEQEDGSIALRILGIEVHIIPDTSDVTSRPLGMEAP